MTLWAGLISWTLPAAYLLSGQVQGIKSIQSFFSLVQALNGEREAETTLFQHNLKNMHCYICGQFLGSYKL